MFDEIDRMFTAAAPREPSARAHPATGVLRPPGRDSIKARKEKARRALAARAAFERARPSGTPPLPLTHAEREALKGYFDICHMVAHYARSWEASDYSDRHPSLAEYAAGILMFSSPGLRYNEMTPQLALRFPPKLCPGLSESTYVDVDAYWRAKTGYPAR